MRPQAFPGPDKDQVSSIPAYSMKALESSTSASSFTLPVYLRLSPSHRYDPTRCEQSGLGRPFLPRPTVLEGSEQSLERQTYQCPRIEDSIFGSSGNGYFWGASNMLAMGISSSVPAIDKKGPLVSPSSKCSGRLISASRIERDFTFCDSHPGSSECSSRLAF